VPYDGPQSEPSIDAVIQAVIQATATATAAAEAAPLIEHFGGRHDTTADRITELEQRVAIAVSSMQRQLDDIHRAATYTQLVANRAFGDLGGGTRLERAIRLDPTTPRPIAIDRACAADPALGVQRVDLPEFGLTVNVRPGSDPATVWAALLQPPDAEK
jgi:hypothetical protein